MNRSSPPQDDQHSLKEVLTLLLWYALGITLSVLVILGVIFLFFSHHL